MGRKRKGVLVVDSNVRICEKLTRLHHHIEFWQKKTKIGGRGRKPLFIRLIWRKITNQCIPLDDVHGRSLLKVESYNANKVNNVLWEFGNIIIARSKKEQIQTFSRLKFVFALLAHFIHFIQKISQPAKIPVPFRQPQQIR